MAEPHSAQSPFGLLAEFNTAEALVGAAKAARRAGFISMDAYSPFPVAELDGPLSLRGDMVQILALAGGIAGAALGYGMQLYTNWAFPIPIGGRPLFAWQSFMLITFELTVLGAVSTAIVGMLLLNRLPRLHHPLFDVEAFHLASNDKFFLVIFANDRSFDPEKTRGFLTTLKPIAISLLGHGEEPE